MGIITVAKQQLGQWITEGTAVRGWYTCEITGKKFRGANAEEQFAKQNQTMEEIKMEDIKMTVGAGKEITSTTEENKDNTVEVHVDHVIMPENLVDIDAGEEQTDAEETKEEAQETPVVAQEEKPKAKKPQKLKEINLADIKEKYPHVVAIVDIDVSDQEDNIEADSMGVMHMSFPALSEKLTYKTENEMIKGKRVFRFYEIECDCGESRIIKPQDAFQVKRCEVCTEEWRKAKRRK